eukprot:10524550-Lingulodinium_polyedra.AAC.1
MPWQLRGLSHAQGRCKWRTSCAVNLAAVSKKLQTGAPGSLQGAKLYSGTHGVSQAGDNGARAGDRGGEIRH